MNKGVEILLARMDTNPEEFENNGRWVDLFNQYKKFMSIEEQDAILEKLKALKMEQFEQKVVKQLLQFQQHQTKLTTNEIIEASMKTYWKDIYDDAFDSYTLGLKK